MTRMQMEGQFAWPLGPISLPIAIEQATGHCGEAEETMFQENGHTHVRTSDARTP
jgi:hypothetical protein